jgi:hypothetical protein
VRQSLDTFKTAAFAVSLVFASFLGSNVASAADEERDSAQPLFVCGTDPEADKGFLELSGTESDFAVWENLRFERTADLTGELVYSYPPPGGNYKPAFLFSHSDGAEGYLVSIHWIDGGMNYVYYSLDIPPDPAGDDMGGGEAALVVSRGGALVERIACAERPYMFISYMRAAMSCDETNPYGAAACAESSFERSTPLDLEAVTLR